LTDNYEHLEWIAEVVAYHSSDSVTQEEIAESLARSVSLFSNLDSKQKRDVFLFLLGSVTNNHR
jgi:hypothetical protein